MYQIINIRHFPARQTGKNDFYHWGFFRTKVAAMKYAKQAALYNGRIKPLANGFQVEHSDWSEKIVVSKVNIKE